MKNQQKGGDNAWINCQTSPTSWIFFESWGSDGYWSLCHVPIWPSFTPVQPQSCALNCHYRLPLPGLSVLLNRRREFLWTGDLAAWTLFHYSPGYHSHWSAIQVVFRGNSRIRAILCWPESLWQCKKPQRLQWKQVQLCVGNCGRQSKAAFCSGHLHKVCLVAIWVNSHTRHSSFCGFICLLTLQTNNQTYFFLKTKKQVLITTSDQIAVMHFIWMWTSQFSIELYF